MERLEDNVDGITQKVEINKNKNPKMWVPNSYTLLHYITVCNMVIQGQYVTLSRRESLSSCDCTRLQSSIWMRCADVCWLWHPGQCNLEKKLEKDNNLVINNTLTRTLNIFIDKLYLNSCINRSRGQTRFSQRVNLYHAIELGPSLYFVSEFSWLVRPR